MIQGLSPQTQCDKSLVTFQDEQLLDDCQILVFKRKMKRFHSTFFRFTRNCANLLQFIKSYYHLKKLNSETIALKNTCRFFANIV